MNTYAERLAWAMVCQELSPQTDQTTLAKLVGPPCKPQNIQHLLDPNKNAKSSKYTPRLASVLHCDVLWLADGSGRKPEMRDASSMQGGLLAESDKGLSDSDTLFRVNPGSDVSAASGKVSSAQLEELLGELTAAWQEDRLTPRRFFLLRELLHEVTENTEGSIESQKLATRGAHGRRALRSRRGTGTE